MTDSRRPELGELTVGQDVIVRRSANDSRRRAVGGRYIPAVVTKVGRVWVELKASETAPDSIRFMTWRMRMDIQDEGTQYSGSNASFWTLEQHAWHETQEWAYGVLKENGITLEYGTPWRGRVVELADLIVKGTAS